LVTVKNEKNRSPKDAFERVEIQRVCVEYKKPDKELKQECVWCVASRRMPALDTCDWMDVCVCVCVWI